MKIIITLLTLVILGIAGRLLPHVWNTTPLLALTLFASTYFGKKYSALILITILSLSDVILGTYEWHIMLSVYGSFALACFAGAYIRRHKTIEGIVGTPILFSTLFYLITNYAVWQWSPLYDHTLSGLLSSYTMAIPFFKNSLTGDIVYTVIFFEMYEGFFALKKSVKKYKKVDSLKTV